MVKKNGYTPDRGDIVWLNFDPAKGHEQKGKRPALVVSPKSYNKKSGLALVCPVTSQIKGYPFEITVENKYVSGAILVDQVRCVDWLERGVKKIVKLPPLKTKQAQRMLSLLLK